MAIIEGTQGNDSFLPGTLESDEIYGLGGDDYLFGDEGDDRLYGSDGKDVLDGWYGNDTLDGGNDNDSLNGGSDNDELYGGAGDDYLYGNEGDDRLYGAHGNDRLDGGTNNDTLYGDKGDDYLYGYIGNDYLFGDQGNDTLIGSVGNDYLFGGSGDDFLDGAFQGYGYGGGEDQIDTLTGGGGRDTFKISYLDDIDPLTAGTGDYTLIKDFNPQQDFIQLIGAKSNYYLATSPDGLPTGTAIFFDQPGSGPDELIAIVENDLGLNLNASYFTTTVNDYFYGSPNRDDRFDGGQGDDFLDGRVGNDSLTGSTGNDSLVGGTGNDFLSGGCGNDTLRGVVGDISNYMVGSGEIDTLSGGAGIDRFILGEKGFLRYGPILSVFYDDNNTTTTGTTDYALIQDFDLSQDVIQLLGAADDYILGSTSGSLPAGTGIYVDKPNTEPDELIAILQGVSPSSLSLSDFYFGYVSR